MTEAEQSFRFEGLASKPVPSILRGFSAPVILTALSAAKNALFLLAHDTDPSTAGRPGALWRESADVMVTRWNGA